MDRYQTIGSRIVAAIIDSLVFLPVVGLYMWLPVAEVSVTVYFIVTAIGAIVGQLYNVLLHWKYGQTLGKMVAKVKVLDISERPISFWQACLRDIFYIAEGLLRLSTILALFAAGYSQRSELFMSIQGYLLIPIYAWLLADIVVCLTSKKKRALHDLIARTVVVRLDVPGLIDNLNYEPPSPDAYDDLRN